MHESSDLCTFTRDYQPDQVSLVMIAYES